MELVATKRNRAVQSLPDGLRATELHRKLKKIHWLTELPVWVGGYLFFILLVMSANVGSRPLFIALPFIYGALFFAVKFFYFDVRRQKLINEIVSRIVVDSSLCYTLDAIVIIDSRLFRIVEKRIAELYLKMLDGAMETCPGADDNYYKN